MTIIRSFAAAGLVLALSSGAHAQTPAPVDQGRVITSIASERAELANMTDRTAGVGKLAVRSRDRMTKVAEGEGGIGKVAEGEGGIGKVATNELRSRTVV